MFFVNFISKEGYVKKRNSNHISWLLRIKSVLMEAKPSVRTNTEYVAEIVGFVELIVVSTRRLRD